MKDKLLLQISSFLIYNSPNNITLLSTKQHILVLHMSKFCINPTNRETATSDLRYYVENTVQRNKDTIQMKICQLITKKHENCYVGVYRNGDGVTGWRLSREFEEFMEQMRDRRVCVKKYVVMECFLFFFFFLFFFSLFLYTFWCDSTMPILEFFSDKETIYLFSRKESRRRNKSNFGTRWSTDLQDPPTSSLLFLTKLFVYTITVTGHSNANPLLSKRTSHFPDKWKIIRSENVKISVEIRALWRIM
jgi:hypothetical protein